MTSASSMHEAGHSKPGLWDNAEGYGGEGGWGGLQDGGQADIWIPVADSCQCMAKKNHNIVKQLSSNENKLIG